LTYTLEQRGAPKHTRHKAYWPSVELLTGYVGQANSGAGASANSTGFEINNNVLAANTHSGEIVITKVDTNTYAQFGIVASQTVSNTLVNSGGSIALASELERVRITTASGANQFDAGKINIAYE